MIRVAAVGDIHLDAKGAGSLRPHLENLSDRADVLLNDPRVRAAYLGE